MSFHLGTYISFLRHHLFLPCSSPSLPAHEDVSIRILVSAPSSYPTESPPQLQLLSRYVGAFGVDPSLFGSILRTFISISGVEWSPDTVCVFDGLQSILERCEAWYEDKLNKEKVGELIREDNLGRDSTPREFEYISKEDNEESVLGPIPALQDVALPEDIKLVEAEPIVDRKSVFIGRACQISHPSQVCLCLAATFVFGLRWPDKRDSCSRSRLY